MRRAVLWLGLITLLLPAVACSGDDSEAGDHALSEAFGVLPASTQRVEFTDVAAIEQRLGVDDLSGNLSEAEAQRYSAAFSDAGEDGAGNLPLLGDLRELDWNPTTVRWEARATDLAHLDATVDRYEDDVDLDDTVKSLEGFGYHGTDKGDAVVLRLSADASLRDKNGETLPDILGPTLVAIPDEHLLVDAHTEQAVRAFADGDVESASDDGDLAVLVEGSPEFVVAQLGSHGCRPARILNDPSTVPPHKRSEVAARYEQLGTPDAYAVSVQPDGTSAQAELRFGDDDTAAADSDPRTSLLRDGTSPALETSYADLFDVDGVTVDGADETIDLSLSQSPGTLSVMMQSSDWPFAACPAS